MGAIAKEAVTTFDQKFGEDTFLPTRRLSQDRLERFFGMVRSGGGSNLNPTPVEVRSRLRLLTLLFAIQRGVRTLSRDGSSEPAAEAAAREEVDSDCPAQLQALEDERLSGQDGEVAADLRELVPSQHQPVPEEPAATLAAAAGEPGEDPELAELQELLASVPAVAFGPAPGPSGRCDLETGVAASDSAMAYVAGFVARKRPADDSYVDVASAEDEPLATLWTSEERGWVDCAHRRLPRHLPTDGNGVLRPPRS